MSAQISSIIMGFLAVSGLFAGLLALQRDPRKSQNRWFFLFALSLAAWMPANFIDSNSTDGALVKVFLYVDLCIAPFIAWSFIGFVDTFRPLVEPSTQKRLQSIGKILKIDGFLTNIILSGLVVNGMMVHSEVVDGVVKITYQPAFVAYIVVILIYFLYAFASLYIRKTHIDEATRSAINNIYAGILIATVTNLLSNTVFPLLFEERSVVKALNTIGYTGLFVAILLIYLAITTKKLFDIRLIVARSLAYLLLGATLVGIYTLAIFGLATRLGGEDSTFTTRVMPIIAALFIAATAPYFKQLFDRITNRFFFRDAYDPQLFLNQLNKSILGNIEIGILLRRTAAVIQENLKSEFVQVAVRETETTAARVFGTTEIKYADQDVKYVREHLKKADRKLFVTDELTGPDEGLKKILTKYNISCIARLTATYYGEEQGIAYLIFGAKKSGSVYNKQDLRIISIVADELVIAIQNALRFEEIQQFNVTLQGKINDATAKLKRTNEKLKDMDETKDEFISMASHQLRTPLTSVKGYLSMVLEGDAGEITDNQKQLLNQAFTSSQRMVYLIADLLNVSRLKTGKFVIDATPTNLADVVEGEIAQLTEQAKGKNLKIIYEKPENFPEVMLDETKIRQVIMNFADNAVYYTPNGGEVRIQLKSDKKHIYFMVKDNGLGVPKDEQRRLFGKFYRASNARKARPDGTGLGLFMAKKVVTAQGGEILFESAEGKGSTFGFSFNRIGLKPPAEEKPSS